MKNNIKTLLSISEEEYYNIFLDAGNAYCEHYTAGDVVGSQKLKDSQYFWTWWENQYKTIDSTFIKKYSNTAHSLDFLYSKYVRIHQPQYMQIYPSDYVITTAFGGIVYGLKTKKTKVCQ